MNIKNSFLICLFVSSFAIKASLPLSEEACKIHRGLSEACFVAGALQLGAGFYRLGQSLAGVNNSVEKRNIAARLMMQGALLTVVGCLDSLICQDPNKIER